MRSRGSRDAGAVHLHRSEYPDAHHASVTTLPHGVNVTDTRRIPPGGSPGYRVNAVWCSNPPTPSRHRTGEHHMHRIPKPRTSLILAMSLSVGLRGLRQRRRDDRAAGRWRDRSTVAVTEPPDATAADTAPPDTAPTGRTTAVDTEPPPPETTIDESWRAEAVAWCDQAAARVWPPSRHRRRTTTSPDSSRDHIALRDAAQSRHPRVAGGALRAAVPTSTSSAQRKTSGSTWQRSNSRRATSAALDDPTFADNAWGSVAPLHRDQRDDRARRLRSPASAAVPPTQRSSRRPT